MVTTSLYSNGEGTNSAATKPLICVMFDNRNALDSSAISKKINKVKLQPPRKLLTRNLFDTIFFFRNYCTITIVKKSQLLKLLFSRNCIFLKIFSKIQFHQ